NPQIDSNQPASQPPIPDPDPIITSDPVPVLSASKRWRDIFKKGKGKNGKQSKKDKDKEKEKKNHSPSHSGASGAELNINIWPFPRSRSAGTRPRMTARSTDTRKSSARKEVAETCGGKIGTNGNNANKAKALNLHVPMCIGYRHHLNCRTDENSAMLAGSSTGSDDGGNVRSSDANVGSG
ncbi:hypothetical protein Golax_004113, partial [Gossypium laxum]|nr:hypothetical protein [Gossypium laxum]